jgi:hypothetical protein
MNDLLELHRLHLPAGRSYVVFARGQLFAQEMFAVDLRLEAFDAVDADAGGSSHALEYRRVLVVVLASASGDLPSGGPDCALSGG